MVRNLIRTQPKFAMAWNVFQFCTGLKMIGSVMILVVLGIVGVTYYAVVFQAYGPQLFSGDLHLLLAIFVLAVFHFLLMLLLWSYFSTVLTDPGGVPIGWKPYAADNDVESHGSQIPTSETLHETQDLEEGNPPEVSPLVGHPTRATGGPSSQAGTPLPNEYEASGSSSSSGEQVGRKMMAPPFRKCGKCGGFKPPRAHHCSVCRRCILKMDHHCVWVVNCVGAKNYKAFLLFLVYTFLETTFTAVVLLPPFVSFFINDIETADPSEAVATFFSFVLNLAFSVSLLGFLIMHSRFVLTNTTTIESFERKRGPRWTFDIGRRRNFEQVFGENPRYWFVPLYCPNDLQKMEVLSGLDYPTCLDSVDVVQGA